MNRYALHLGDCLETLRKLPENSVDSIVTDPPYGLSFMGKRWDYDVPSVDIWAECLRVLKPGGHLLAFAGTRTQHRMAVRIEDAGFEIRDMIAWVYGSGFPKSMDVSKAIDKVRDWSKVERLNGEIRRARVAAGLSLKQIGEVMQEATGGQYGAWYHRGGHMFFETGRSLPSRPEWECLRRVLPIAPEFLDAYDEAEREVIGQDTKARSTSGASALPTMGGETVYQSWDITAPATDAARHWQGWGTALKPALEPITVARKPLAGTVAANVLAHGTGALNIDGCRVAMLEGEENPSIPRYASTQQQGNNGWGHVNRGARFDEAAAESAALGRWPANLIHDGDAAADMLGDAARFFYCAKTSRKDRNDGVGGVDSPAVGTGATMREREDADWTTRNGNHHPTVKPTDLMAYLCRLVTPPGGVVLDPFMGSGSTGKACMREGFSFIGCELSPEYLAIAEARIAHEISHNEKQQDLFDIPKGIKA